MKKYKLMISAFKTEENTNHLVIGEGFSLVEAVVRAVEIKPEDEVMSQVIQFYAPDDFEGLYNWYLERGIYLSEPFIIDSPNTREL